MKRFVNKGVLVTGGTTGIGRAIASAFLREGARVLITGRNRKSGEEALKALRLIGDQVAHLSGDSSDENDVRSWVDEAIARFGKLDVAVNNAGVEGQFTPITAQTDENYRRVFDVNVKGVLLSLKHEIAAMQNHGGAIVNTSSVVGEIGMAGASIYVASKHAVNGLTRSAALETAKMGIRVNAVAPGTVNTPMTDRFTGGDKNIQSSIASAHPVGRTGLPEEIAEAVLYLASDNAKFTTGSILTIDGGYTAR